MDQTLHPEQKNRQNDVKTTLSQLWIVVMLNMVFADIYSIMVILVTGQAPEDAR